MGSGAGAGVRLVFCLLVVVLGHVKISLGVRNSFYTERVMIQSTTTAMEDLPD